MTLAIVFFAALLTISPAYAISDDEISKTFSPPPQSKLVLTKKTFDQAYDGKNQHFIRQYIQVKPSPNTCFHIKKSPYQKIELACKETSLSYRLKDLDLTGNLKWKVEVYKNGDRKNLVDLAWYSDIFKANFRQKKDLSSERGDYKYFFRCNIDYDHQSSKRIITLTELNNNRWRIFLPPVKQEKEIKPEMINTLTADKKAEEKILNPQKKPWDIYDWHVYEISSSQVVTEYSKLPHETSTCRYVYSNYKNIKGLAGIECHQIGSLKYITTPLPCLKKELSRRRIKDEQKF